MRQALSNLSLEQEEKESDFKYTLSENDKGGIDQQKSEKVGSLKYLPSDTKKSEKLVQKANKSSLASLEKENPLVSDSKTSLDPSTKLESTFSKKKRAIFKNQRSNLAKH